MRPNLSQFVAAASPFIKLDLPSADNISETAFLQWRLADRFQQQQK
jgi:hypothetical protein